MSCRAVGIAGSDLLAKSNDQHFLDAAAEVSAEIGVGLDSVEDDDAVGGERGNTEDDVKAVEGGADLFDLHGGFDGDTHGLGGDTVAGEHFELALGGGSSVAAHGGGEGGAGARPGENAQGGLDDVFEVGDAAAADSQCDSHARFDLRAQPRLGELLLQKSRKVEGGGGRKALLQGQHFGEGAGRTHAVSCVPFKRYTVRWEGGSIAGVSAS